MSISYNYEIINVDQAAKVMEIVYTAPGRSTMHISGRLPYVGESLDAIVAMYSPVAFWTAQEAEVQTIAPGTKGTHAPKVKTPAEVQAELERQESDLAKANLAKLRDDTFPDVLGFLATLSGAPKVIKDAAIVAIAEKVKVK